MGCSVDPKLPRCADPATHGTTSNRKQRKSGHAFAPRLRSSVRATKEIHPHVPVAREAALFVCCASFAPVRVQLSQVSALLFVLCIPCFNGCQLTYLLLAAAISREVILRRKKENRDQFHNLQKGRINCCVYTKAKTDASAARASLLCTVSVLLLGRVPPSFGCRETIS